MNHPIIHIEDLWFRYPEQEEWTIRGINFTLYKGEWVTILGGNGSGKSTFAKLLNGLLLPSQGKIERFGQIQKSDEEIWRIRQKIGMIFQNPENQIVAMTVEDDIAFGLENIGIDPDEIDRRINEVLEQLKLIEFRTSEPYKLSGGQKQRLAIAGVLAMQPEVIIFDESTSMLDPLGAKDVLSIMESLREQGISIIHITHEMDEVFYSDRAIIFKNGQIVAEGTPRKILADADMLASAGLIPPFAVRVREALRKQGLKLEKDVISEEELAGEIWTLRFRK